MNSSVLGTIILGLVLFVIILAFVDGLVLSLIDAVAGRRKGSSLPEKDSAGRKHL